MLGFAAESEDADVDVDSDDPDFGEESEAAGLPSALFSAASAALVSDELLVGGACGGRLGRVIIHIPTGAFELKRRSRQRTLEHALASGTLRLGCGVKALYLFELIAALCAAIGI